MTEPFGLPVAWQWAKFQDVASVDSNLTDPAKHLAEPHIAPNHIESKTGRLLEFTTVEKDGVKSSKHIFYPGHILYSKIRPYLAKAVVVDFKGLCSADMYPVSTRLDAHFLHRWMLTSTFTEQASRKQGRTVLPKINQDALSQLPVPVPPLNEQRRIVAKIEDLSARSRAAKEALDAIPPLLERFRQSVLAAAFRGDLTKQWREQNPNVEPASVLLDRIRQERRHRWEQDYLDQQKAKGKTPKDDKWKDKYQEPEPVDTTDLSELPKGWCWASLNELSWHSGYGTSAKCSYEGEGIPVLRIPNVAKARTDLSDLKFAELALNLPSEELLRKGDFLVIRTNGSLGLVGRGAVVSEDCAGHYFASYLIRHRLLLSEVACNLLNHYWQSLAVRRRLERTAASSAGQHNVNLSKLQSVPIPLPPNAEQAELNQRLEQISVVAENCRNELLFQESKLEKLDQSILAKAFRGELVPQDPNDEPASVLLERIRAEREAATSSGNGKKRKARA